MGNRYIGSIKPGLMGSRRKRILLIYSLVMLIPGIILGYLAYRGILNDQALREKQARMQLESISSDFFDVLNSNLDQLVQREKFNPTDQSDYVLLRFEYSPDTDNTILDHNLLYLPNGFVASSTIPEEELSWQKAWELEFVIKNFGQAYIIYKEINDRTEDETETLKAEVAMARVLNKQNLTLEAVSSYENISQKYPNQNLISLPARTLALNEIYKIQTSQGDTINRSKTRIKLLNSLLEPSSNYEKSVYSFFANQVLGSDSLSNELISQQLKTDQAIQIFNEAELLFNSAITNPYKRYYYQKKETLGFISFAYPDGIKTGLVIDLIPYIQKNRKELFSVLNETEKIVWKIEGSPAWSDNSNDQADWISFPLPDQLPKGKLKISVVKTSWISSILTPGNGVFLFIFIFIILIMFFGLGFTIHILNQELKLNRLKSEFISNVSHELKSPLTSIRQMTEMLSDQRIETEDQRNDYYGIMLDQSEHLSHLIDNILDFSRMEEDRKYYRFEEIDLVPLIDKLVENFRKQLIERGFVLEYKSKVPCAIINADKDSIIQIIYNLLDNAVKYSEPSQTKIISLSLKVLSLKPNLGLGSSVLGHDNVDQEICLTIQDKGMGISKKDKGRIFDRFYRSGESQKLAIKGSGIGLTLVKRIVEAHQGRIEVESMLGEGSAFYVFIPILKDDANEKDTTG